MASKTFLVAAFSFALAVGGAVQAQELANACHASSSYDLTIAPGTLLFDRADPAPRRIELRAGKLLIDGAQAHVNTEDSDRLVLFERELRDVLPKARSVGERGVDLATQAVRAETAALDLTADTQSELDHRLASHAADLKRRIAVSNSTHDWQGGAFDSYADDVAADIVPLLAADLGTQAVSAALTGDLDAAATLRDRAAHLADGFQKRIERRMQALRPQIQTLCPSIVRLYELQRDIRGPNGHPLDLLQINRK